MRLVRNVLTIAMSGTLITMGWAAPIPKAIHHSGTMVLPARQQPVQQLPSQSTPASQHDAISAPMPSDDAEDGAIGQGGVFSNSTSDGDFPVFYAEFDTFAPVAHESLATTPRGFHVSDHLVSSERYRGDDGEFHYSTQVWYEFAPNQVGQFSVSWQPELSIQLGVDQSLRMLRLKEHMALNAIGEGQQFTLAFDPTTVAGSRLAMTSAGTDMDGSDAVSRAATNGTPVGDMGGETSHLMAMFKVSPQLGDKLSHHHTLAHHHSPLFWIVMVILFGFLLCKCKHGCTKNWCRSHANRPGGGGVRGMLLLALRRACLSENAADTRDALLTFAVLQWPTRSARKLDQLAKLVGMHALADEINKLDKHLKDKKKKWSGRALWAAFEDYPTD